MLHSSASVSQPFRTISKVYNSPGIKDFRGFFYALTDDKSLTFMFSLILSVEDKDFEGEKYRKTCMRFFKLMCATSLGKVCVSDHAMHAMDEMSALNRDLKQFYEENGAWGVFLWELW